MVASGAGSVSGGLSNANLSVLKEGGLFLVVCAIVFVMSEPAPYELALIVLVALSFLFGLSLPAVTAPLLGCLILYILGGLLAVTQVPDLGKAPLYMAVSAFLAASSVFYAAVIAARPQRLELIVKALCFAGAVTALLGSLGYFGLLPSSDAFLRYGRAKGSFEDPNVFAAFLLIPLAFTLRRLLTGPISQMPGQALLTGLLTVGVFLSFSRAGWGLLILLGLATVIMALIDNRSAWVRVRAVTLSLLAVLAGVAIILTLLATSDVADVFRERASLTQSYDVGAYGRFERHWLGLILATEKPLGIGPGEFWKTYVEDPHNVYLKSFLAYGWLGGISYLLLIMATFLYWVPILFRARPWREINQSYFIVFCLYCLLGWIIDTDHWRHMYLLFGMAWGLIAAEARFGRHYEAAQGRLMARPA